MNASSLNPILRNHAVIGTVIGRARPIQTQRNPLRAQQIAGFNGESGVELLPLNPNFPDALSIVANLQALSEAYGRDPVVRAYTERILPGAIGNNALAAQIDAVANFVRNRLRFVQDPAGTEYVIRPTTLLGKIEQQGYAFGDCDDHVLLLNSMLRSLGFDTKVVGVKLYARDRYDHVISMIWDGRQWVDVDTTVKIGPAPTYRERLIPS